MISYAILACNEAEELDRLLAFIAANDEDLSADNEIVVLLDSENATDEVREVVESHEYARWYERPLRNDFASQKNYLTSLCSQPWVFNIDADELPSEEFMRVIGPLLEANNDDASSPEVFFVPRENYVLLDGTAITGKTPNTNAVAIKDIVEAWRWRIDEHGRVNYPDMQARIYRNNSVIKWKNTVHEVLEGHDRHGALPRSLEYSLIHTKDFYKQFSQNAKYNYIEYLRWLSETGNWYGMSLEAITIDTEDEYVPKLIRYYKWKHPYQGDWDLEFFVPTTFKQLRSWGVAEGSVVLDIGAQSGNMSVAYANLVGESGKVISFEPNPASYEVLERNSKLYPQIDSYNYAITDQYSIPVFHYSDNGLCNGGFATRTAHGVGVTGHTVPVRVYGVVLDTFLRKTYGDTIIPKVDFVKVDAEGHDMYILKSMADTGLIEAMGYPTIQTEVYDGLQREETEKLLSTIRGLGYTAYDFENDPELTKPIASVDDLTMKSGYNLVCFHE